jgi:hypothetical protein
MELWGAAWRAMQHHGSQWGLWPYWWRRVAVFASRYSYVNTWTEIATTRNDDAKIEDTSKIKKHD